MEQFSVLQSVPSVIFILFNDSFILEKELERTLEWREEEGEKLKQGSLL